MISQALKTQMLDKLDAYITSGIHGLRGHQVEAVNITSNFLRQPNQPYVEGAERQGKQFDGGSIRMATGTGKTHTALETAVGMCQPTADDPEGKRAIIVSPRISINSQFCKTYTSPQGLHCSEEDIGIYDSSRSDYEQQRALNARYLVTTREGFISLHERGLISPDPNNRNYRPLVIPDESDTFLGYKIGRVLRGEDGLNEQQLNEIPLQERPGYIQNSMVLGFTATDYGVNHHLFNDQPSIHSLPLVPAVQQGLLTHGIKSAAFQVTPDDQEVANYVREHWQRQRNQENLGEGNVEESPASLGAAEKFAMDKAVINEMIRFHSQHVDDDLGNIRNMPTLIAAPTIKAAERIAARFNEVFGDQYAMPVSGNTPRENVRNRQTGDLTEGLDSIIQRFNNQTELVDNESGTRKRAPRILVFPDVLGRGVDIKNATVLLSCRNYLTPTLAEQHLGRITREQDDNFLQMFGHDKVALAANFNLPGIRPIRFNDIIGGRVVYDDRRDRKKAESSPPPPPPPNLPEAGQVRAVVTEEQWNQLLAEEARQHGQMREGWHTVAQAAQIVQLPVTEISKRARGLFRNRSYTPQGLPPSNGEATVIGSDLKRNDPNAGIILSDSLVQAWRQAAEENRRRREAGHQTEEEVAKELGVDVAVIREMRRRMEKGATTENLGEAQNLPPNVKDQLDKKEDQHRKDEPGR
jgi:superfamily II DNA or RNA helicase